mmetsp:Transcript_1958/g.3820  ORF Transcript_1958/g.3820 Transcript_1958/m.3820 type:complete len:819 (-) Transcript_1958:198-2654(-)
MQAAATQKHWRTGQQAVSFSIRRKGISKKRRRKEKPITAVSKRPKSQPPAQSSKTSKPQSATSSDGSSDSTDFFVNINQIIHVRQKITESNPETVKKFMAEQLKATEKEVKGGLFNPRELVEWMRENDRLQLRARFTEMYAGKTMRKLRYKSDSLHSFESRLAKYQLQANLATKTSLPHKCLFGEGYFAIDKLVDVKASFTLHLFQAGFSINSRDKGFQPYTPRSRAMLQSIDNGEIPAFSEGFLQQLSVMDYHNGCLIVDLYDYRHANRWSGDPKKSRVLLRPTTHTISRDALTLATNYREKCRREGKPISNKDFTKICIMFEEKMLMALGPLLCYDPSVRVMQAATVANYNRKMNTVRRISRGELRAGLKPVRTWKPWKRSISTMDFETLSFANETELEDEDSSTMDTESNEEPSEQKETKSSSTYVPLFMPRDAKLASETNKALKMKKQKAAELAESNVTRDFSKQLMRYASYVYFTKNARSSYTHGLLLRDPVLASTLLAGTKHSSKNPKSVAPQNAQKDTQARAIQANKTSNPVTVNNDAKKYWPGGRRADDASSQQTQTQQPSRVPVAAANQTQPKVPTAVGRTDAAESFKRRFAAANGVAQSVKPKFTLGLPPNHNPASPSFPQATRSLGAAQTSTIITNRSAAALTHNGVSAAAAAQRAGINASPNLQSHPNTMYKAAQQTRLPTQALPTATTAQRQQAVLLQGANVANLQGKTETPKAQTVVPQTQAAAYNNLLKAAAIRQQQQALMSRALAQKQLQHAVALAGAAGGGLNALQLQQQYLLMAQAYRNQLLNSKKKQQMLNGTNTGKPK